MTKVEQAYIAGIFDGEGCVYFRRKGQGSPQLQITQKHRELLDWISDTLGFGKVYFCGGRFYVLCFSNRHTVRQFVRVIYPYSRVKKESLKRAYLYHQHRR